jgi:hypothetical protein
MQSRNPFTASLSVASPFILHRAVFTQAAVEWIHVFCPEFLMSVRTESVLRLQKKQVSPSAVWPAKSGSWGAAGPWYPTHRNILYVSSSLEGGLETDGVFLARYTFFYSVALVRERTIPAEQPPLVGQLLRIEGCHVVSAADPLRP